MPVANSQNVHPILGAVMGGGVDPPTALTVVTGNEALADPVDLVTGAQINTFLATACTDITDPAGNGGWNSVWDLSASFPAWVQFAGEPTYMPPFGMRLHSAETAGDALRMRLIVDSNTLFDYYVIRGAGIQNAYGIPTFMTSFMPRDPYGGLSGYGPIYVESSIALDVAKVGTIDQATSMLGIPGIVIVGYNY